MKAGRLRKTVAFIGRYGDEEGVQGTSDGAPKLTLLAEKDGSRRHYPDFRLTLGPRPVVRIEAAGRRQKLHLIRVHEYMIGRRPTVWDLTSALIVSDRRVAGAWSGVSAPVPDDLKTNDVSAAVLEEPKRRKRPSFNDN